MKRIASLAVAAFVAGSGSALAADCSGTYGWLSSGQNITLEEGHTVFVGNFSGSVMMNDTNSTLHLNAVMCPGIYEVIGGKTKSTGFCWQQDNDGDRIYYKWSCSGEFPHCDGDFAPYAGTGKYEGISGSGTFKAYTLAFNELGNGHGYAVWDTCEYALPN
jgi:hypothetical protein